MSDDFDDKDEASIERHVYGSMVLMDALWRHIEQEVPDPDNIRYYIEKLTADIYEYYSSLEKEVDVELEQTKLEKELGVRTPGIVIPFPGKKDKDWGNN